MKPSISRLTLIGAALRMIREDVASAEDVDIAIRDGIGLRWSFMGPFETIDLNAPGGMIDYCTRYTGFYKRLAANSAPPAVYESPNVDKVVGAWKLPPIPERIAERSRWRNRRLAALAAHKRGQS